MVYIFMQAASPGPVLNAIPLSELDEKSQTQVTAFLNKISAFPTKMSAVKITTISTTFLASVRVIIQLPLLIHIPTVESQSRQFTNHSQFCYEPKLNPTYIPNTSPSTASAFPALET